MSSEIEKIVNRFKELEGKQFTKIPQLIIENERALELVNEELDEFDSKTTDLLAKQKLEARKIAIMRAIAVLKSRLVPQS